MNEKNVFSIAHHWFLIMRPIQKEIKEFAKGKKGILLDIGSGKAPFKKEFKEIKQYVGLDLEKNNVPGITEVIGNAEKMPFENEAFDVIISNEALEHVENPQKVINESYRVLKKGGTMFLSAAFCYMYHPYPNDYYRFTIEGMESLFKDFSERKTKYTMGVGSTICQMAATKSKRFFPLIIFFNCLGLFFDKIWREKKFSAITIIEVKKQND